MQGEFDPGRLAREALARRVTKNGHVARSKRPEEGQDHPQIQQESGTDGCAWESPVPLGGQFSVPNFPVACLPSCLSEWVSAEAEATQTPADLAAMLALSICGAALAKRIRVLIRQGWSEPLNLFTVAALAPGERKSAVFSDAMLPVQTYEKAELDRMGPEIAELASKHRALEKRLKHLEDRSAKAKTSEERSKFTDEAKELAKELESHSVPDTPRFYCDDVTPEKLVKLLARQGGRMLLAAPEGTAFEIAKGRYSDAANFEVFLKGHSGDSLRVDRVSRDSDIVDQPALSLALAVQPDVIRGLADQATMRARGFLARFLFSLPKSKVGRRKIPCPAIPAAVAQKYHDIVLDLWRIQGIVDEHGKPAPNWIHFSQDADHELREFERWLEPLLAEGEELSYLSGWANKLAGAIARITGIIHVAGAISEGHSWEVPIKFDTICKAIQLGRDYLLPHAFAAFGLMEADKSLADAQHVWDRIEKHLSERSESSESALPLLSRRDIHQLVRTRYRFARADELDPVLVLLEKHGYLRPVGQGEAGRGHSSPLLVINPKALVKKKTGSPCTHYSHYPHSPHIHEGNAIDMEDEPGGVDHE
jgi:hypothetical protein